jgi:hypothetical protein
MGAVMKVFFGWLAAFAMCASPAMAQNIGGEYSVRGTNLDGSAYKGSASIVLTSETTCEIYWTTGGTTSQGICMRNGNAFSAGYMMGDAIGLVIYEIKDNGAMEGLWTIAGRDGNGTEILTPQ